MRLQQQRQERLVAYVGFLKDLERRRQIPELCPLLSPVIVVAMNDLCRRLYLVERPLSLLLIWPRGWQLS